jgi:hypothetical protein
MPNQRKAEKAQQNGRDAARDHEKDEMARQKAKAKSRDSEKSQGRERKEGW